MAEILVTTNKDVEGTKSADVITLISGSSEVDAGKGNDIVIDASAGGNEVELGQGDDLMKVYVDANLLSENEYEGGKGFDTLMLMLNKEMFDDWMATSLVYDFEHKKGEFDFSHYYSMLGVNLRWEAESFEHLVLNRIASAEDDLNIAAVSEDQTTNIVLDVLANDDDSLAEIKEIVAVSGAIGHVEISADGKSLLYNPNGQFEDLDDGESRDDIFTYTLKVTDPNSPNIVSYTTATVTVHVDGVNDKPVAQDADFVMDDSHPTATPKEFQLVGSIADKVSDIDNDPLSITLVSGPAHGLLVLNTDGTFTYTSDGVYSGLESFVYKVSDGLLESTATVDITVPIYGTNEGDGLNGNDLDNIIYAGAGRDEIAGLGGNDIIYAGDGDDSDVDGGAGNDIINAGSGSNFAIYGGSGNDTFVVELALGSSVTINDFNTSEDILELITDGAAFSVNVGADTTIIDSVTNTTIVLLGVSSFNIFDPYVHFTTV